MQSTFDVADDYLYYLPWIFDVFLFLDWIRYVKELWAAVGENKYFYKSVHSRS